MMKICSKLRNLHVLRRSTWPSSCASMSTTARAIWNEEHGKGKKTTVKRGKKSQETPDGFRLKKTRDEWVKDAFKKNIAAWTSRTHLSGAPS